MDVGVALGDDVDVTDGVVVVVMIAVGVDVSRGGATVGVVTEVGVAVTPRPIVDVGMAVLVGFGVNGPELEEPPPQDAVTSATGTARSKPLSRRHLPIRLRSITAACLSRSG